MLDHAMPPGQIVSQLDPEWCHKKYSGGRDVMEFNSVVDGNEGIYVFLRWGK